jgi:hypothetical protein
MPTLKDMVHNINLFTAVTFGAHNSATTGTALNLLTALGAPYYAVTIYIRAGTVTDGTHTPIMMESADGSTYTTVALNDLIIPATNGAPKDANGNYTGAFANLATAVDQKVGYIGTQPYIRCDAADSGATGATFGIHYILGNPRHGPV